MIDTHCHVDLYPRPTEVADAADRAGVLTIIVTNLPSAFEKAYPYVQPFSNVRLALGLHPLVAAQHPAERSRFKSLISKTSYIGEVGLDFSRVGYSTKEIQIESFQFVLETLRDKPKFITLHSRQAESTVIDLLEEADRSPVVFHWYSGTLTVLNRALNQGHYFSVNPAMIVSPNGQKIIANLPPERVLTETDGPFVKINGRAAIPSDVSLVEEYLSTLWNMEKRAVKTQIKENFLKLVRPIRTAL